MVRAAGRLIRAASEAAREDVAVYRREPERLPELQLGSFEERPPREAAQLRVALRLRVPPRLVPGDESFVRTYAFWHEARRALRDADAFRRLTHGTTVLMYHAFGDTPSRFVLPLRELERQLRWLRRRPVVGLGELAEYRRERRLPPADAVAITIDDGYADVRAAVPILRRYDVPATVFVVTGKTGEVNDWDRDGELTRRPLLSWEEVAGLARDGVEIGAHSRSHPQLPLLGAEDARAEIAGSREDLEHRIGEPPAAFAYPFGRVDEATAGFARDAGFALACGLERGRNGPATPPHRLRRLEVDGRTALARFALALAR